MDSEPTRERPDEAAIYGQIGRFIVMFQALESELVQLAGYALDPEQTGRGRREATDLWFGQLVARTADAVASFLAEHRPADEAGVAERLDGLLAECRALGQHRNRVVHSAYLFIESGDDLVTVIRSDAAQRGGVDDSELDQEVLENRSFEEAMERIAETAFGIGQCRLQLIHWYRPLDRGVDGA